MWEREKNFPRQQHHCHFSTLIFSDKFWYSHQNTLHCWQVGRSQAIRQVPSEVMRVSCPLHSQNRSKMMHCFDEFWRRERLFLDSFQKHHQFKECFYRATIWNIAVILPLLGITWLFGLFSVNEDTLVFQYIFAICNSLQVCFVRIQFEKVIVERISFVLRLAYLPVTSLIERDALLSSDRASQFFSSIVYSTKR